MKFTDRFNLDAAANVRLTKEGYLVAFPRVARAGVQIYTGDEVGKPAMQQVRVYRPPEEVFHTDSLTALGFRPVTDDHPPELVTAETWADVAVGQVGEQVARDGEFVRASMLLMDAAAIKKVQDGKAELSVGYTAELVWGDGTTPEGLQYDAKQTNIRANHLAVVGLARGGPQLRIGDADAMPENLRKMIVDGIPFETTDAGVAIVERLQRELKAATDAATTSKGANDSVLADIRTKLGTAEGEITALKAKLADAEKATTPAALDTLAANRAKIIDAARKIVPNIATDGKTDAEIRRLTVAAKLGDEQAKTMSDDQIGGAFAALAPTGADPMRDALRSTPAGGDPAHIDAWKKSNTDLADAWKNTPGKA